MNPIVFNYTLNGVPLKRVDTACELGITTTNSLSGNKHIECIISKASRMSDLVKSSTSRKNIKSVETIQRSITRYVLHYADIDLICYL